MLDKTYLEQKFQFLTRFLIFNKILNFKQNTHFEQNVRVKTKFDILDIEQFFE